MTIRSIRFAAASLALVSFAAGTYADQATFGAKKDNTLYQSSAGSPLSNGAGAGMYCGKNNSGSTRRALFEVDPASIIPAGATITSVRVVLYCTNSPNTVSHNVSIHRVLSEWGESYSVASGGGGAGDIAAPGDCSWFNRFEATATEPALPWTASGGDYVAAASASRSVAGWGQAYEWASTPELVADVQGWLDNPASNHGWMLRGNESTVRTARKWGTREETTAAWRPKVVVDYTVPPQCNDVDFNNDDLFPDVVDIEDFLVVFAGGSCSTGNCDTVDFNNDGLFPDTADIDSFLRVFAGGEC